MIAPVTENDDASHRINLIFENVGLGIALNIHFNVDLHGFIIGSGDPLENLPVILNGIPTLGPKRKFVLFCAFYLDLYQWTSHFHKFTRF